MIPIIWRLFSGSKLAKNPESDPKISITSINLRFMGNSHGLDGVKAYDSVFKLNIPFQNKMGSELLPDNINGPNMRIDKISVSAPFTLLDVDPKLPVDVGFMSKVMFRLRIKGPDVKYEGPLSVNFGNDPTGTVNVAVKKIVLHYKGKTGDLENSQIVSNMQKSQVFRQEVQLYKIMSFGDTLNAIIISRPFEIVGTDPKLPIALDRRDSYVISMFIKAPEASYSGDIEVTFE